MYLGAKLRKVVLENIVEAWGSSTLEYMHEAVSNSEDYLHDHFGGQKFAKKVINPFELEYDFMDLSAELGSIFLN